MANELIRLCEVHGQQVFIWSETGVFITKDENDKITNSAYNFEDMDKKLRAIELRELKSRKVTLPCINSLGETVLITGVNVRTFQPTFTPDESGTRIHDPIRNRGIYVLHDYVKDLLKEKAVLDKALVAVRDELRELSISTDRRPAAGPREIGADEYTKMIDDMELEHRTKTKLAQAKSESHENSGIEEYAEEFTIR